MRTDGGTKRHMVCPLAPLSEGSRLEETESPQCLPYKPPLRSLAPLWSRSITPCLSLPWPGHLVKECLLLFLEPRVRRELPQDSRSWQGRLTRRSPWVQALPIIFSPLEKTERSICLPCSSLSHRPLGRGNFLKSSFFGFSFPRVLHKLPGWSPHPSLSSSSVALFLSGH